MPTTITVPSGGGGASVTLVYATQASASLATSLLSAVYQAAAANTLVVSPTPTLAGGGNEYVLGYTATGSVTLPAGYDAVIDAATGPVTLTGSGDTNVTVVAGAGAFSYAAATGAGTIVAGAASDTFVGGGYALLGDATYDAFVSSGTVGGASSTVTLSGSSPVVSVTGTAPTVFGSGSGTNVITDLASNSTVDIDAGATTVNALSSGGLFYDLSGSLMFVNSGANTVIGTSGSGAATIFGSSGNSLYSQGADPNALFVVGGTGADTLSAGPAGNVYGFAGPGGALTLLGSSSSAFNYLVGGTGAATLNAAASIGTTVAVAGSANADIFLSNNSIDAAFGGSGTSTIVGGTTASGSNLPDLYAFVNGSSGGNDTIENWGPGSSLVFINYGSAGDAAIQAAVTAAPTNTSSVSLTLPDQTKITITGINGAHVNINSSTNFYG